MPPSTSPRVLTARRPRPARPVATAGHVDKPLWRGWLHLVWFELSLVVGTLAVTGVDAPRRPAVALYAVSVTALFGTSALYHRGDWRPRVHRLLQRLDHTMIFVLIAGTATPVFATALDGPLRVVLLAVMWTLALAALLTHLVWMHAPELLVGSTYVGLGCLGAVALPAVWVHSGVTAAVLLACGGALYVTGAVLYHLRRPDPIPSVFGFHEVFHTLVCAAATLHYVAVVGLVR